MILSYNQPLRSTNSKPLDLTRNQSKFVKSLDSKSLIFLTGPAGSGKTFLSCKHAIEQLSTDKYEKLIITRPAITISNEQHGFLPGDIEDKMSIWAEPIIDNLSLFDSRRKVDQFLNNGKIAIQPLGYIRGKTFKDCIVLADEMQNTTKDQMLALLTRIGSNCQMIVIGDQNQSDIITSEELNGLSDFQERFDLANIESEFKKELGEIDFVTFDSSDIKRSHLVKVVCELYEM